MPDGYKAWITEWTDARTNGWVREWISCHQTYPRLAKPVTFNEKVLHRLLFDRRPILRELSGRLTMRAYVESRLGSSDILPKIYHRTTDPGAICFDHLPDRFVVKPTHCSGFAQVVTDKRHLDVDGLVGKCRRSLKSRGHRAQWAGRNLAREIIVEEFVDDGSRAEPTDYKLFVFDGVVRMIQVDRNRFTDHQRRLYTSAWERMNARFGTNLSDIEGTVPRPPHLDEMIGAAQKLGAGLDFIRADFYDTEQRLYFGEFAVYPDAGLYQFDPTSFDLTLGKYWEIRS